MDGLEQDSKTLTVNHADVAENPKITNFLSNVLQKSVFRVIRKNNRQEKSFTQRYSAFLFLDLKGQ